MRIITTALAICAVSFAIDVAGDLSIARHPSDVAQAASAHAEVPPYLAHAVRAHPLPVRAHRRRHTHETVSTEAAAPVEKPLRTPAAAKAGFGDVEKAARVVTKDAWLVDI